MKHTLRVKNERDLIKEISIIELGNLCSINIECLNAENFEHIELNSKDLHSFIGALLHVQQKIKGTNNG